MLADSAEPRGQKRCRETEEGELVDELPTASSATQETLLQHSRPQSNSPQEDAIGPNETHDLDFIQALLDTNQSKPHAALQDIPDTTLEDGEEEEDVTQDEEENAEHTGVEEEGQPQLKQESEYQHGKEEGEEEEEEEDTLAAKAAALLARRQPSTLQRIEPPQKEAKPKVASCQICHSAIPKYTCPRCSLQTCSLSCVKRHKAEQDCSGVRDAAAFVAYKEYDEVDMHKDLHFLEEMTRLAENSARETLPMVQSAAASRPQRPHGQRNTHRGRFHKKRKMQRGRA